MDKVELNLYRGSRRPVPEPSREGDVHNNLRHEEPEDGIQDDSWHGEWADVVEPVRVEVRHEERDACNPTDTSRSVRIRIRHQASQRPRCKAEHSAYDERELARPRYGAVGAVSGGPPNRTEGKRAANEAGQSQYRKSNGRHLSS